MVEFEDIVEGVDGRDDWTKPRASPSASSSTGGPNQPADLQPAIEVKDNNGKVHKLARGGDARYLLAGRLIWRSTRPAVKAGDLLARIPLESAKTRDITGGLPRVAELFEARRPKEPPSSPRTPARSSPAAITEQAPHHISRGRTEGVEYLIPKGKHIYVQDGDIVEKGDYLVDGNPAPHDILAIKGVEELAAYLVNEIQEVYRLQGVTSTTSTSK